MRRFVLAGVAIVAASGAATLVVGGVGNAASRTVRSTVRPAKRGASARPSSGARASAAAAGGTMYLRVNGAPGEVTDVGYANQIAVTAYDWLMTNNGGKLVPGDLVMTLVPDRSVPPLETDAAVATDIPLVIFTEVNSSGQKVRMITLTHAKLDSIDLSGSNDGSGKAEVKFSYQQEQMQYYYYGPSGTGTVQTYRSCYDVASNSTACP